MFSYQHNKKMLLVNVSGKSQNVCCSLQSAGGPAKDSVSVKKAAKTLNRGTNLIS